MMKKFEKASLIWVILTGLLFILLPSLAKAELPPPTIWIAPVHYQDSASVKLISKRVDQSLRDYLGKSSRVEVRGDQKNNKLKPKNGQDPRVPKAENLKYTAVERFKEKKYQESYDLFKASLKMYQDAFASVQDISAIFQCLSFLGAAALELGFDEDAKDYFKQLASIVPEDFVLDGAINSVAMEAYQKEHKSITKKKVGALQLETDPPGAVIKVDGRHTCISPCEIGNLYRGMHYIQASNNDQGIGSRLAKVKGGMVDLVKFPLTQGPMIDPNLPPDATMLQKIAELTKANKIDQDFRNVMDEVTYQQDANYAISVYIAQTKEKFVMATYLYGYQQKQTVKLDDISFKQDFASMNVELMKLVKQIENAAHRFPNDKAVDGQLPPLVDPKDIVVATNQTVDMQKNNPNPGKVNPIVAENRPSDPSLNLIKKPVIEEPINQEKKFYHTWWFWSLTSAVVVGGATITGFLLIDTETTKTFSTDWSKP
jgi:hypothetical protein